MKKLVVILLATLVATSAFAVIDPDPDGIGIYFDETADVNCIDAPPLYMPLNIYVVWTNPSIPEFTGYEFSVRMEVTEGLLPGVNFFRMTDASFNGDAVGSNGYGDQLDLFEMDYAMATGTPLPTAPATIIHKWQYAGYVPWGITCYMFPAPAAAGNLQVLGTVQDLHTLTHSTGGDNPVATAGGDCGEVVGVEEASFGSVKSLFR